MRKLICPKCKSTDISNNMSGHAVATGAFQNEHKCNKCGHTGIFPEIERLKRRTKARR